MDIPAPLWKILQLNNGLDGIKLFPKPKPNKDGSYSLKMTPKQFKRFQENQKQIAEKPATPQPASSPVPDEAISVSEDPSMSRLA